MRCIPWNLVCSIFGLDVYTVAVYIHTIFIPWLKERDCDFVHPGHSFPNEWVNTAKGKKKSILSEYTVALQFWRWAVKLFFLENKNTIGLGQGSKFCSPSNFASKTVHNRFSARSLKEVVQHQVTLSQKWQHTWCQGQQTWCKERLLPAKLGGKCKRGFINNKQHGTWLYGVRCQGVFVFGQQLSQPSQVR